MVAKKAIAKTRRSAKRYTAQLTQVLENTSDCVFTLDGRWCFKFLNGRAVEEIVSGNDVSGRHILEVFPLLTATPFWEVYQQVMVERSSRSVEGYMPGLDHWYEVHTAPLDDGIAVFFRNIDERKSAERDLQKREDQFKRTLNHMPQMVWSTRPDGHHDYYNHRWYEFTGVPIDTTDGDGWNGMFHPDDRESAWAKWEHSLIVGEPYDIEYRLRHHTGEYRWVLGRAWPERNELGEILRWYGTCTDIHDRIVAQQALQESRTMQEGVLDASADCIKIISPDGLLQFMNRPGVRAMELECFDTVRDKPWLSFWPEEEQAAAKQALACALEDQPSRFSGFCPTVLGTPKWWDVVITPIKDEHGKIDRLLSISRDITMQRETTNQLKWTSEHDALTGLPNRRAFAAHLQAATIRAMQSGGKVVLLLIDLDHFKHVNDTLGHPAGDQLLTIFARRLRESVRSTDFVSRLGGDEFAIVLEGDNRNADPVKLGEAIVERLRQPVIHEGRNISGGGASIGGAVFPNDGDTSNELLKNADIALYALKDGGRGGIMMFQSRMREQAQLISSQLHMARVALSDESIEPHYQKKVELATGRVVGMEALLRWRHGTRGLQLPDTVLEAFSNYELAAKIGDLMQRKVFRDLRGWLDHGLPVGFIAINAAPVEFLRDDFAERFFKRLSEYSIPPSLVEIEITEQVFLERGSDYVGRALKLLHKAGVRIALDDFGTGHSSLSHLRDYPVDVVKIDRTFVDTMTADQEVRSIVSAVIHLAHSLKIDVVAEGVETDAQRKLLIKERCRLGQGFYFGRAVEADKIPHMLTGTNMRLVA